MQRATILYVDSDDVAGVDKGSLQTAADAANGGKIANVKYLVSETDGTNSNAFKLDLLVIEVNNEFK